MPSYSFEGKAPKIDEKAYVHESAQVIGDVTIGEECFVGAGVILRGDYGSIRIGPRTAVEEGTIIHAPPNETSEIGSDVTIGHGAIIHSAEIGTFATIGMGAVLGIHSIVGQGAIIGEGSVVTWGQEIPPRKIALGNPAKVIRDVGDEKLRQWSQGKELYVDLSRRYPKGLKRL